MIYEINDTADYFLDGYFNWIVDLLCDDEHNTRDDDGRNWCRHVLEVLFHIPFSYTMQMDSNRHADGIDLRYRYAYENGLPLSSAEESMYDTDCCWLEMMTALALRIEEHIMSDPDVGDRTSRWFWQMIESMDIKDTDYYDDRMIFEATRRVTNHTYHKSGKWGLFTIQDPDKDMRTMQIWDQAMAYLSELLTAPYI